MSNQLYEVLLNFQSEFNKPFLTTLKGNFITVQRLIRDVPEKKLKSDWPYSSAPIGGITVIEDEKIPDGIIKAFDQFGNEMDEFNITPEVERYKLDCKNFAFMGHDVQIEK